MVSNQKTELAAKRWAKALMELAQENSEYSKDDIYNSLSDVSETFESSFELTDVVNNPSVSAEEKQIIICKLFQGKIHPLVYNFLFALNLKKRLNLIPGIVDAFRNELEILKNIIRVDITSAVEINDLKRDEIKNKISEKLGKDVIINWDIDTDIIAGLIFKINDTIIDNSVRNKLEKLGNSIIKA